MSARTLADLVTDIAAADGDREALIFRDEVTTYRDLDGQIEHAMAGLANLGIEQGDRVGLYLPNIPQFALAYYGVLRLGAVVVPLNVLYGSEELAYIANDCGVKAIVTATPLYPAVAKAVVESPSVAHVVVVGDDTPGTVAWSTVVSADAAERPRAAVEPGDLAVICYTSGTTGRPKGAMLTHRNFVANLEQIQAVEKVAIKPGERTLLVLPLFHIFGMNVGLNWTLWAGGTIVLVERFVPQAVAETIQRYRCSCLLAAPPMIVAWVNMPGLDQYDLKSIRSCLVGAAPLPVAVLNRFKELTGVEIQESYGLTETAPLMTTNAAGAAPKAGTVGPAGPGIEVRIVDRDDRDVPLGEEGEIVCRGENIFTGYWKREAESAEALRNGWFHSGDIGTMDSDGYVTIVDRMKDMINAGGFKIWPREVEEILFKHPAVQEAAVVAAPDAYKGEVPVAFVALKAGQQATQEEIISYCAEHLAKFKVPTRVDFRESLPKLPTGKVLRRMLRDEAKTQSVAGAASGT